MPRLRVARNIGNGALLERGEELTHIQQTIAALKRGHGGGLLIIQGVAGIGKSTLLRAVCEQARGPGVQTLTARASELERDFGFGIVRQLLEARMVRAADSERTELLSGAAALAGPVLGLAGKGGDSFAALHGLYWLVSNLTVNGPVVLAVDDLQWADEPSLRWLAYLCHRLEGLPVLVAATTRAPRPGHCQLLTELLATGSAQILRLGPLSNPAVARLVHDGLDAMPDAAFVAACARASGGNPFVLRELILDLAADGVAPVAAQATGVAERVPGQVERTVLARFRRLDEAAMRLAEAVAVLGEGTGLRLAAALANLDIDTAAAAADALLTAELFDEGRPLQFLHPLVRSAVYEQLASGARARAHARAARLLIREGAGCEQVGAQLLLCEPARDAQAVRALQAAAAAALDRGAPETAVTYLRRALAESPAENDRTALLGELGGAERIARDPAAVVHLERAWHGCTDPVARARLADQLANVLLFADESERSMAVLQAGLDDLDNRDPDLEVRLRAAKAAMQLLVVRPAEVPELTLEQLRDMASRSCPASRSAQLVMACTLAFRGESCHEVAGLVERGWDDGRFLAEETCESIPALMAVIALNFIDELDRVQVLVEAMLVDAQARGSVVGLASVARRGLVALRRGTLAEAEADTCAALELATEHNLSLAVPVYASYLGLTLLERGKLDQAAVVVEGITLTPRAAPSIVATFLEARGRVRLACGRRAQAITDLYHCGRLADGIRLYNPNLLAWRSTLALALAPEHPHEARALAGEELELARRAGSSRAIGIALRVCGLLTGGKNGIELLQQSVAALEHSPMRLELAHSLTELGAALRRAGTPTAARQPLRQALDLAARCGATPLAERAREEALATGARPRKPWISGVHALTPSELRVARLAAQAMRNRDIAQALFITTKTVSDHLSNAYRKLNIDNRDQLASAMTADQISHSR
jgi:DNA-binding CsgD family transcriptional regulator